MRNVAHLRVHRKPMFARNLQYVALQTETDAMAAGKKNEANLAGGKTSLPKLSVTKIWGEGSGGLETVPKNVAVCVAFWVAGIISAAPSPSPSPAKACTINIG